MTKPSIAELLIASGHTDFNWPLVRQAIQTLYGDVGANLDERDWSAIMAANNPMAVAEQALKDQWQDAAYLLRNADLPGFSQEEQEQLAVLALGQRGKLADEMYKDITSSEIPRLQLDDDDDDDTLICPVTVNDDYGRTQALAT